MTTSNIGLYLLWMKFYFRAINIMYHLAPTLDEKPKHIHTDTYTHMLEEYKTLRLLVKTSTQIHALRHPPNTEFT